MKLFLRKSIPHVTAVLLFLIATSLYFLPLMQGKGLSQHDIQQFKGSAQEVIEHREQYGEEPLWTNSMFSGMPAYLISTKYEGNKLSLVDELLRFTKYPSSLMFVALLGFYILLLALGVNPWLSIVGAFAYALSSYFFIIIEAGHNAKMHAIAYVAPMLAGVFLTFKKKYWAGFVLFALFFGLNLKTGHVQITYYAAFIGVAIAIGYLLDSIKTKEYKQYTKALGILVFAALLAVGANFSRLYFTYESGKYSIRGASELSTRQGDRTSGLDKEYATAWSYGKVETLNLLIPNLMGGASAADFGTDSHTYKLLVDNQYPAKQAKAIVKQLPAYWGPQPMTSGPVYIGAIVIFLFMLSLFVLRGNMKWALLGVTVLGIMLAWGKNFMPLTDFFLHYFPGYNKFRTVSMILYIAEFTIPLLAIMGLQELFFGNVSKERFMKGFKWSLSITGGICLFFILFGKVFFSFETHFDSQYFPPEMLEAVRLDRQSMMRADAFRSLAFILLSAGTLFAYRLKKFKMSHALAIFGVLIIADMWTVNQRYLSSENFVPQKMVDLPFTPSPADMQILADNELSFRVYNRSVSTFNDASTSYYHKSIGGYHGAKLRRYQELIDHQIAEGNIRVLNMLNTRYVIDPSEQGPVALLNPGALGNAWFVDSVTVVDNADQEMVALNSFDPKTTAVVDKRFAKQLTDYVAEPDENDQITLTDYRANRLVYQYSLSNDKVAVFSEIYYPAGWEATINGEVIEHIRVNYVLRGAILPKGNHEVVFEFKPKMFKAGYAIDLFSSLIIIVTALGWIAVSIRKSYMNKN
ncbi:MAG: YfhO family protein [Bacteroidales bacterium]